MATNLAVVLGRLDKNASRQMRWNLQAERGAKGTFDLYVTVAGMAGVQLHTASMKRQVTIQPATSDELRSLSTNFFGPLVIEIPRTNTPVVVQTNPVFRPINLVDTRPVTNIVVGRPVVEVFTIVKKPTIRTNVIGRIVDLPAMNVSLPSVRTNQTERTTGQADWRAAMRSRIAVAIGKADALVARMLADERRRIDRMIDEALVALSGADSVREQVGQRVSAIEAFLDGIAVRGGGR